MFTRPLKCLYALTLYLFILELLHPFTFLSQSPYAEVLKAHTKFLSLTLEVGGVYFIYFINSWYTMTFFLLPFIFLSKTLRTRLEYLKERTSEFEVIEKANRASEPLIAYPILAFLFLLNGMMFNREGDGDALTQYSEIYDGHIFVFLGLLLVMVPWGVFCCVSVILRGESLAVPDFTLGHLEKGSDSTDSMTVVDKSLMLVSVSIRALL